MSATIRVAAAPISWGVCEVPGWGRMLDAPTVLGEMAELGVTATELGPPGYLPRDPAELKTLLGSHGLRLIGGFLAVVLHENPEAALAEAEDSAALFAACGAEVLVLAAATGLEGYDQRPALSDAEWSTLISTAAKIRDVAAAHGLKTVLHPHVGTHAETQSEVERFLADSDLPLCLDTGHLLIGGTDPAALVDEAADRIVHVHLKDVDAGLATSVALGWRSYTDAVRDGMYRPLGQGDVDVARIVRGLTEHGYQGWYVLEQDTILSGEPDGPGPLADVEASVTFLRSLA